MPQIEVTFDIDANGILHVAAKDKATSKEQSIRITSSSGLNKDEVENMKRQAQEHAAEDKKKKEAVEIRNQADSLVFQTKKQLEDLKDKLSSEQKGKLESEISKVEDALKTNDAELIKSATESLTKVWNDIAQDIYKQQGPGPEAQPHSQAGEQQEQAQQQQQQSQKKDEKEVQDASYEVVDDK